MQWKRELLVVAGSLVLALPASGQPGAKVLVFLHRTNQDKIELANLAKDRSSDKAVKDYADLVIGDHKKADDELQSFAKSQSIDLRQAARDLQAAEEEIDDAVWSRAVQAPTGEYMRPLTKESLARTTTGHKWAMEDLGKLDGPEFDRQFAKTMASDHKKVIERLKTVRSTESDRDLTQLIDKLLPMLQKHESAAHQLESRVSQAR